MVNAVAGAYRREVAGGGDLGRARRGARAARACCCTTRAARSTRSSASTRRSPAPRRGSTTPPRAPAEIARVLRAAHRPVAAGLLELPRDMVGVPCAPVPRATPPTPADPDALAACADEIMARLAAAQPAGADGRRRGAPLRPRGQGRRARATAAASRWSPASWAAACSPRTDAPLARHLSRRGRRSRGHRAGRGLRRAAAAGRDPVATPISA